MNRLYNIINSIGVRIAANVRGTPVTLDSYTASDYTFPSDGYVCCAMGATATAQASVSIFDANRNYIGEMGALSNGDYPSYLLFVKKGMKTRVSGVANSGHVYFYPIGGGYCIAVFSRLAVISSLVRRWRHEQTIQHSGLHGRQNQKHDYHFSSFNNHHKNRRSEQECNSTRRDGIRVCVLDKRFNVRLDREPVLREPRRKDNQCLARYCNGIERSAREHSLSGIISQGITTIPERGCVA